MKIITGQKELLQLQGQDLWTAIARKTEEGIFPRLTGGLDSIAYTKNQIIVRDIGINNRDNSFIIRK